MNIGEYCDREVVVAERGMEIREAAALMKKHHVGDIVIVEREDTAVIPVGIVTDRDLVVEVLAEGIVADEVSVKDVMTREIATIGEDQGVWETLESMRDKGIRRLPVVDARGGLVGLVTVDDLLDLFTEAMENMTRLIRRELTRESRTRRT